MFNSEIPKWLKIVRNALIVFGLLFSQNLLRFKTVTQEDIIYALGFALVWAFIEFQRLYQIKINHVPIAKKGGVPILLS